MRRRAILCAADPGRPEPTRDHPKLAALRRILRANVPATWLVTGDDCGRWAEPRASVSEALSAAVREGRGREKDVVVDTTQRGDRMRSLAQNLAERAFRFEPTAAFLLGGLGDPRAEKAVAETDALARVLQELLEAGVTPVLLPTPRFVTGDQRLLRLQRRRIRELGEDHFVPVLTSDECETAGEVVALVLGVLGLGGGRDEV